MTDSPVRVGVLGCGNVGGALIRLIEEHADIVAARAGRRVEVARVAVRDIDKPRDTALPRERFTDDGEAVVTDPEIDVVVEVIGGVEPARTFIGKALGAGKPVVTANKELLATHGKELIEAAAAVGVDLLFEAAVAGGIPIMRPLRESLAGERITRLIGIVNGTTNYILTRMTDGGSSFEDALAEAQARGYAEADPTADVDGLDAAHKCAIMASVAFGAHVTADDVFREGIGGVTADDIAAAGELGYVIKPLAVAEATHGAVAVRVHPALVPAAHPLAAVRDSFNAVFIEGVAVGELMLYGPGAGGPPTASAVLGDLIDAVRNLTGGGKGAIIGHLERRPIRPVDDLVSEYYVHLEVVDQPGVLAQIADVFGRHAVSIMSVQQKGLGEEARLLFVTHTARERDVQATILEVGSLGVVRRVASVLRVIGEEQ